MKLQESNIELLVELIGCSCEEQLVSVILPDVCPTARSILLPGKIGFG
jgi:hypothetical protein